MTLDTIHKFASPEAAHHFREAQWWADVAGAAKAQGFVTATLAAEDWQTFHLQQAFHIEKALRESSFCMAAKPVA